MTGDAINPDHYKSSASGIECIQITRWLSFNLGNAVKYIYRRGLKGDALTDLRKAEWYLKDEISRWTREHWQPWPEDPRYEASTSGQIRNARTGYVRKPVPVKNGYMTWMRNVAGKPTLAYVHRTIWETFLGPIPQSLEVRHRNGRRADCHVLNLDTGTRTQNSVDRRIHGTDYFGEDNPQAKLTNAQADEIRGMGSVPTAVLVERYGVSPSAIERLRRGESYQEPRLQLDLDFEAIVGAEADPDLGACLEYIHISVLTGGPGDLEAALVCLRAAIHALRVDEQRQTIRHMIETS